MQYRCSVFNDTAIPGFGYRDSGQMIPIPFIMNSYALQRKFITKEVTIMTKYREIIRLAGLNLSQTNIALSCNASKTTVNKVLKAAKEQNLVGPWILTSKLVEQQSYRSCMGLLKLADKYSVDRLEAACCKALTFTATPSYKSIKNILDTGSDRTEPADKAAVTDSHTSSEKSSHALTRGADYYRR